MFTNHSLQKCLKALLISLLFLMGNSFTNINSTAEPGASYEEYEAAETYEDAQIEKSGKSTKFTHFVWQKIKQKKKAVLLIIGSVALVILSIVCYKRYGKGNNSESNNNPNNNNSNNNNNRSNNNNGNNQWLNTFQPVNYPISQPNPPINNNNNNNSSNNNFNNNSNNNNNRSNNNNGNNQWLNTFQPVTYPTSQPSSTINIKYQNNNSNNNNIPSKNSHNNNDSNSSDDNDDIKINNNNNNDDIKANNNNNKNNKKIDFSKESFKYWHDNLDKNYPGQKLGGKKLREINLGTLGHTFNIVWPINAQTLIDDLKDGIYIGEANLESVQEMIKNPEGPELQVFKKFNGKLPPLENINSEEDIEVFLAKRLVDEITVYYSTENRIKQTWEEFSGHGKLLIEDQNIKNWVNDLVKSVKELSSMSSIIPKKSAKVDPKGFEKYQLLIAIYDILARIEYRQKTGIPGEKEAKKQVEKARLAELEAIKLQTANASKIRTDLEKFDQVAAYLKLLIKNFNKLENSFNELENFYKKGFQNKQDLNEFCARRLPSIGYKKPADFNYFETKNIGILYRDYKEFQDADVQAFQECFTSKKADNNKKKAITRGYNKVLKDWRDAKNKRGDSYLERIGRDQRIIDTFWQDRQTEQNIEKDYENLISTGFIDVQRTNIRNFKDNNSMHNLLNYVTDNPRGGNHPHIRMIKLLTDGADDILGDMQDHVNTYKAYQQLKNKVVKNNEESQEEELKMITLKFFSLETAKNDVVEKIKLAKEAWEAHVKESS